MRSKYTKKVDLLQNGKKLAVLTYTLKLTGNSIQQEISIDNDKQLLFLASTVNCDKQERDVNLFIQKGFVYSKTENMYLAEVVNARNGNLDKACKLFCQKCNADIVNILIDKTKEGVNEWNELQTLIKVANEFKDV